MHNVRYFLTEGGAGTYRVTGNSRTCGLYVLIHVVSTCRPKEVFKEVFVVVFDFVIVVTYAYMYNWRPVRHATTLKVVCALI